MFSFQAARNLLPERHAKRLSARSTRPSARVTKPSPKAGTPFKACGPTRRWRAIWKICSQPQERNSRDLPGAEGEPPAFRVTLEGARRRPCWLLQDEVYRIAREILRNAFCHAHASRIEAEVAYDANSSGCGSAIMERASTAKVLEQGARPGHWGLPGVRERAKRIGAQVKLWSEPGAGTETELTVPARIAYRTQCIADSGLRLFRKRKV